MKNPSSEIGTIYGVGLGPGAVDLMSVRANNLLKSCSFIAFFRKAGRPGHARQIVSEILPENVKEYPNKCTPKSQKICKFQHDEKRCPRAESGI